MKLKGVRLILVLAVGILVGCYAFALPISTQLTGVFAMGNYVPGSGPVIPEPATLLLFGIGLIGFARYSRKF